MSRLPVAVSRAVFFVVLASAAASAQRNADTLRAMDHSALGDSALEARTSEVASQLRCPVCQGLSLQDSPSELAQSMRAVVRDQLAQGRRPDEVKAYFVSKYGEWTLHRMTREDRVFLLAPKPRGLNLLVYAVPVLTLLGGGAAIFLAVRRWTSPSATSA